MTYTKTSPFLRFSPFWAFFRQKGDNCSPQAIKRGREGKETPSAHPERLQRKAVGGRRAAAPRFWRVRPRPSGCRPSNSGGFAGAPCPSRSASAALAACASLRGVFSALMARGAAGSRVLVPPGLRRRRPSGRRAAVRVRDRAAAGRGVEVGRLPRPLAASPSSVWSAWPLAALSHASARRAGAWPLRPFGAPAACLRALAWPMAAALAVAWGRAGLIISRGLAPLPPPRPSKGASPFPPSCSPDGSHPSGNYSGGRGARSRAPRLWRGRLRAGRAPLHPRCLCGLPPGLRPCALRLPRRVRRPRPAARVAPVVRWSGSGAERVVIPPA